jgi:hypothetical protein
MRLLCSPEIRPEDLAALEGGASETEVIEEAALRELETLLAHPLAVEPARVLANLIAASVLEIRFAVNVRGRGIFHDKVGIFHDAADRVLSFSGSINESWSGWHPLGNHETFEVFRSWEETRRTDRHVATFEQLWAGKEEGIDVCSIPEAFEQRLLREAADDPLEALSTPRPHISVLKRRRLFDHHRRTHNPRFQIHGRAEATTREGRYSTFDRRPPVCN